MRDQARPSVCRRVVAMYNDDALCYAAREIFRSRLPRNANAPILVRFIKYDNVEWVDAGQLVPLVRRDYRLLQKAGFPGMMDHANIAELTDIN
jgi:hypothetical protein